MKITLTESQEKRLRDIVRAMHHTRGTHSFAYWIGGNDRGRHDHFYFTGSPTAPFQVWFTTTDSRAKNGTMLAEVAAVRPDEDKFRIAKAAIEKHVF